MTSNQKRDSYILKKGDSRTVIKKLVKRRTETPMYLKHSSPLVVFAKPNGKLHPVTRIIGYNLNEILSNCTQVMKLTSAARKLFLNNGKRIHSIVELEPNQEVHVSLGEPFIDPIQAVKDSINIRAESFWGLNGLYIPKSKRRAVSAAPAFGGQSKMWRILTFSNGEYLISEAVEIISDLKDLEEMKALCSSKHGFNGQCRRLFLANYQEIFDLNVLHDEESFVWNFQNNMKIMGPIWASKGEDLDQKGVYKYFQCTKRSMKSKLKELKEFLHQLKYAENGDKDQVYESKVKSFSKPELKIREKETQKKIEILEKNLKKFQAQIKSLPEPLSKTTTESDKCMESRAFKCTKGLKLQVYLNGHDVNTKCVVFFNVHQAQRGVKEPSILFNRLLDCLSENENVSKANDLSKGLLVRRIFSVAGQEISDVAKLSYGDVICVSYGDDWIDPEVRCIGAELHLVNSDFHETMFDVELNKKSWKTFQLSEKCYEIRDTHILPVLQNQTKKDAFLLVSISAKDKNDRNDSLLKSWLYTVCGRLILKNLPSLCLTLLPNQPEIVILNKCFCKPLVEAPEREIKFYQIQLCPVRPHDQNQMWGFNNLGLLFNKAFPEFFLTYLENRMNLDSKEISNVILNSNIVATTLLPDDLQSFQRWAFKQESFKNLNQWKLCEFPNPEWHKRALTWPLMSNGDLNTKLIWPIDGYLVPCTPPFTKRKCNSDSRFPLKLMVLKNNDHSCKQPVLVTGPDLTKLIKKGKQEMFETHCSNEGLLQVEFQMFLDSCTSILGLPSAARRLFDESGSEKFNLQGLSNNNVVFVSMGDMWCSPDKSLNKIELRTYANKLAVDVERLKYFVSLNLENDEFVVGIKNECLEDGSRLEVQLLNDQSRLKIQQIFDEDHCIPPVDPVKEPSVEESPIHQTYHEKNCEAANLRFKKMTQNEENTKEIAVEEKKIKPVPISHQNLQQFSVQGSKILVMNDPKFGVFAEDIGKPLIIKKFGTDLDQSRFKWIIHKSGSVESFYYRGYVMSTNCPRMLHFQDRAPSGFLNSPLVLEKAINAKYGKALQMFNLNPRSGLCHVLFTNSVDKGITAAHLSGICTHFVSSKELNQTGAFLEMDSEQKESCSSCIALMNGRYPISSFENPSKKFACFHSGGFKVLRRPLDLSENKCSDTYQYFVKNLDKIRKKLTVTICKTRFSAFYMANIQVLLRLNGFSKDSSPHKVTGKSILQIMELATGIFNLQRPVKVLYTRKGQPIFDDLSYRNVLNEMNDVEEPATDVKKSDSLQVTNEKDENRETNEDSNFNVTLSDDQQYFIIEFVDKFPIFSYTLQINISGIHGINIFHEKHEHQDSAFLFNYEIFNNQINTELFFNDFDFEGEQTELSIRSSPRALNHFFSEVMKSLRLQLISARVNKSELKDDYQVEIESIDAITDFSFEELAGKLNADKYEDYSAKINLPLISTETFEPTEASVTIELTLKQTTEPLSKQTDKPSPFGTECSVIEPCRMDPSKPVELWASVGEPFHLEDSTPKKHRSKNVAFKRLKLDIDKKKFLLRNMKGERFKKLNSGTLEATPSMKNPVKIKGNWQFPPIEEIQLKEDIEALETQLNVLKQLLGGDQVTQSAVSETLYKKKLLKQCFVHLNGERGNSSVSVWGESIWEILQNSLPALRLKKTPRFLFDKNGKQVTKFEEINSGDIFAVSSESTFVSARDSEIKCEIKANWGRARRQYGVKSTDINIQYRPNTVIDVNPFDPPSIMTRGYETPSAEPKTIRVFENGQPTLTVQNVTGNTLSEFLQLATKKLSLNIPAVCLYTLTGKRITEFNEILHDDLLAVSVTGKGLLTIED